ncbi:MAG: alpha/beta hydrolase [Frankiales bacterium]|nr:alpha/beta hydrolase [Frankiales bacterium]
MDLSVTASGTGEPLVLLVHGVLDNGRSFDRVAELLDSECRLLRYDRRGYGTSADALGVPADADDHVEDLLSVLDGRRAVVVGHSFGGVIAAGAAVRAPELVSALVLYESVMAWVPGWDDRPLRQVLWGEDPEDAGLRLMFGERYHAMTAEQRQRRRAQATSFVVEERSVRGPVPPYEIADLQVPLVYGYSDTFPIAVMQQHLNEVIADVELVAVPGGGHNAHRDAPEAFADLVRLGLRLTPRP